MKKLTLIAALLLAGCGGGGGGIGGGDTHMPPAEPTPLAPTIDGFFAAVSGVVSAAPDESEPAKVDALAATAPEDRDPSSL